MSFLDDPIFQDPDTGRPPEDSSFRRGLRSGVTSLKGQFHALAGGVGEAVGADEFARERYARSRELQAQAAEEAPATRAHDVHDLRSGYDYVTGLAGQMAPMAVPAIASAMITKRPILGPTAVMAGPEAGDIIQRQQEDSASLAVSPQRRLASAVGGGTASAAVMSAVPGATAERIAGRTAATAARSLPGFAGKVAETAAVGGVTTAGGEALKQAALRQSNQDLPYDPEAIKEAGVGGAVGGALLGVPGAAMEGVHGAAQRAGTSVAGAAKGLVAKSTEGVTGAVSKAKEGYSGLFNREATKDDATARAVAQDKPVEPMAPGADPAAHVAASDAKATDWATAKLKGWLDDSTLDPETKAKAADLLAKVGDPTARAEVATMDLARKASERATAFYDHMAGEDGKGMKTKVGDAMNAVREHVAAFAAKPIGERVNETRESISSLLKNDDINDSTKSKLQATAASIGDRAAQAWVATVKKATELKDNIAAGAAQANVEASAMADQFFKQTKKSEDYSGARAVIAKEITPLVEKAHPEVLQAPGALDKVANGIRLFFDQSRKGDKPENDARKVAMLRELLGPDATAQLTSAYYALHGDEAGGHENIIASLAALTDANVKHSTMRGVVEKHLKDKTVNPDDAVEALRRYALGEHTKGASESNAKLREFMARGEIDKAFGKDADKVLEAFQKEHEGAKSELQKTKTSTREEGDLESGKGDAAKSGVVEHTLEETSLDYEPPRIYRGKDKAPVKTLEAHRRDHGDTPSQVERLMERARKDNPDRNVSFVSAKDFERNYGEKLNVPEGGKPEDYGVIAAEGQRQEGRITEAQARAMRFDEDRNASTSKSRVKLEDGTVLDAYKITQQTLKSLPYIEGESSTRRTARAFFEGLGSALIHFDTTVKELPDSTVIAVRNGVKITVGDVAHYKGKGEYSTTAKLDLASELQDMRRRLGKADSEDARKAILKDIDELEAKIAGRERDSGTTIKVLHDREFAGPLRKDSGEPSTVDVRNSGSNSDVSLEKIKNAAQVYELDPKGEIHLAALDYERQGTLQVKPLSSSGKARDESGGTADASAGTKHAVAESAKLAQPSEHAPARKASVTEDAKDIVAGGTAGKALIERYVEGIAEVPGVRGVKGKIEGHVPAVPPNPKEMQTLIEAINNTKIKNDRERLNANAAIDKLNKTLGETLKKSPDVAYNLQLKKSVEAVDAALSASAATREHVEKYIKDVLGDKVKVVWANIMHAGEYQNTPGGQTSSGVKIDPGHLIRVSVHALDPQGTAYHESLHAFFQMLREQGNHNVMKVLYRAADTAPVMNQLRRLLANEPEALKQIEANREERVAYMYQFYAKERITLGTDTRNMFGRIKDAILKVLGIWTNDQRAQHIMDYFHEGQFAENIGDRNATSRALMEPGSSKAFAYAKEATEPLRKMGMAMFATGAGRLRDTTNPALMKLADLIHPKSTGDISDVGFIQSASNEHKSRLNEWVRGLKGLSEEELFAAHEALRSGEKGTTDRERQAVEATRKLLDSTYDYMRDAGVRVRDLGYGKDYFPRNWDAEMISKNQDAFRAMLNKYVVAKKFNGSVEKVMANLMARDGSELGVVVDMPGMQHTKERVLSFITPEDAAPFTQKNLFASINSYVTQATRRAEWARRFGDDGKGMRDLLKEAKDEHGATQEEVDMAQNYIRGIDGTLGDDISPTARRLMGNMIVYQNIRLLPLAIFSSLIDPGGIKVRGGTWGDAWSAAKRGILEVPRGFKKNSNEDPAYKFAEDIGAIDDRTLVHALGSSYTQGMVAENARKINDSFFKYNLMEQYNMSMRVSAAEAATRFVMRHAQGESTHSERWLTELGLTAKDVIVKDGRPLVMPKEFEAHGMGVDDAAAASNKMKGAINRWVDGAVLRPNVADKPIWMNDPRFMLIAHLKQFTYAFQNTILKRVWHEAEHGNYAPAIALGSYVPMMMLADFAKGMIQGGGQEPEWKKGWGPEDYFYSGVQRAGLLGVSQYSADIWKDIRHGGAGINSVMGPTWEQMTEGVKTLAGSEMFKTFAMHSLPANALYSHAFHEAATDPNFAE